MLDFLNKFFKSGGSRKNKNGGGNCGNSGSKGTNGKCLSASGNSAIILPPPQPFEYGDAEMSNIISKIIKARKEGLTAEQVLNFDEQKAYDNYLIQKKEKNLKFKAKEEIKRIEAETRKIESESRRKEAAAEIKKEADEKEAKIKEAAEFRIKEEIRKKEEEANAQIASYKKANPSRAESMIKNFGKSSKRRKGGKKRSTRRKNN